MSKIIYDPKQRRFVKIEKPKEKVVNTVLSGVGAPDDYLGEEGDFYIDTQAMEIYGPKTEDWDDGAPLRGADGAAGEKGEGGQSIQGEKGEGGKPGLDGKDGANGADGKDGRDGTPGKDGLDGKDGREIEFDRNQTHIVWKYRGENNWRDLMAIPRATGRKGGASSALDALIDTDIYNKNNLDILQYHSSIKKWAAVSFASLIVGLVPYTSATANVNLGAFNLTANQVLVSSLTSNSLVFAGLGGTLESGDLTGDVTTSGTSAATITANAVSNAKFRQSAALSVVGNATNSTANVADIAAATNGNILRRSGTTLAFGSIDLAASGAVGATVLGIPNGGTNASTQATNGVTYFNGTSITSDAYLSYTPASSRFFMQRASEPGSLYFIDLGSGYTQFITSYGSLCTKTTFCNNSSIQEDFQLAASSVGASIILAPTLMTVGTTSSTDLRFIRGSTERLRLNASGALIPSAQNLTVGLAASGTKKFTVSDTTAALTDVVQIQGNYSADGYGSAITFTDATPTTLVKINSVRESNNNIGLSASVFSSGTLRTAIIASSDGSFRTFGTAGTASFYSNSGEHLFYLSGTPYMRYVVAFNDSYMQTYSANNSLFLTGAAGAQMATFKIDSSATYITGRVNIGGTATPITSMTLSLLTSNDGFSINQVTANKQAYVSFLDNGTTKWIIGKQTNNDFFMYDGANARDFLQVAGGVLNLQPSGGSVFACNNASTSRFGVGVNPVAKLQVNAGVGSPSSYANYGLLMYDGGTASGSYGLGIAGSTIWQNSASFHAWYTAGTEQMRLWFGNLGVNSTAPLGRLTICGGTADNHSIELGYSGGLTANYMESINRNGGASVDFVYYMGGATKHRFYTSNLERCYVGAGFVVGAPTGGDKGAGTINAQAVYDDNVLLTDYVFEKYYLGEVVDERFKNYEFFDLGKTEKWIKQHMHLPALPSRNEWEKRGASVGEVISGLWRTTEESMIHHFDHNRRISELNDRINALEETLAA